jgi:ankyrin repeat protein
MHAALMRVILTQAGWTALMHASVNGHPATLKAPLDAGAGVDNRDPVYNTL